MGPIAVAAGFHPNSCVATFSGGKIAVSVAQQEGPSKKSALELISSHNGGDADLYTFAHQKLKSDEPHPVEAYVRERVRAMEDKLSHFERLQIFNRLLAGQQGMLKGFGKALVQANISKTTLYFAESSYLPTSKSTLQHYRLGLLADAGRGDHGIWYQANKVTTDKTLMLEARERMQTLSSDKQDEARVSFQTLRWSLLTDTLDFATTALPIWKAFALSSGASLKMGEFDFVVDSTRGNLSAKSYSAPPVAWYKGAVPTLKLTDEERQHQAEFAEWLSQSQAREDYAELLFALAFDRLAYVINGPNGGRFLNDGKEVRPWWSHPGAIKSARSRIAAIGSDKKAQAALEDGFTGLREVADALPYKLDRSLIYEAQHQYHLAEDSSALLLTLLDPDFNVFKERVDEQTKAATLLKVGLREQIRRAQSLRAMMIESLEAGKVPWDLEETIALAESDLSKTCDLVPQVRERLEAFHAFTQKTMNDRAFVAPENRARFAEFEKTFSLEVRALVASAPRELSRLTEEVTKLRTVYEQSESFKTQDGSLRELARSLWK